MKPVFCPEPERIASAAAAAAFVRARACASVAVPSRAGKKQTEETKTQKGKRRHEGGVEPLALSRSTDLKSAPRTDEDHLGRKQAQPPRCYRTPEEGI